MIEDDKKTGGAGKPVRFNPRANLWRRVSSKNAVSCPFVYHIRENKGADIFTGPTIYCCHSIEGGEDVLMAQCFLGIQTQHHHRECCRLNMSLAS